MCVCTWGGRKHFHLWNTLMLLFNFCLIWTQIYKWGIRIQMFREVKLNKLMDIYRQTPPRLLFFADEQHHLISTNTVVKFIKFKERVLFKLVRFLDLGINWHLYMFVKLLWLQKFEPCLKACKLLALVFMLYF